MALQLFSKPYYILNLTFKIFQMMGVPAGRILVQKLSRII